MPPLIEVQNLNFQYPDGQQALANISFAVHPGEKICLLGANGAGKSTLLLHLNGIFRGNGSVKVNGMELDEKNIHIIRATVGIIFQNPDDQLFSPTVYEDVAYGPYYQGLSDADVEDRVRHALSDVCLQGYEKRNPYHLSSGEKKRAAIATVLSMKPKILIFDEPTAGLDPRARRNLLELFLELPQTMLIATHDLDAARKISSRVIILDSGKIVADGSTQSLLQDESLLFQHGLI